MELLRYANTPILLPDPDSNWEAYNVFNPSVIYHEGLFHMHYRAQGLDWISRLGYVVSTDGVHWNRMRRPVLEPTGEQDAHGVEDPRVTLLEGVFHMAYTAYGASPVVDQTVYVYYGAADHVIGLATCSLAELLDYARYSKEEENYTSHAE